MRKALTFATVAGIPLRVHANWIVTAALVTLSLAGGYLPQSFPNRPSALYWILGIVSALLFFSSVLAHELGHALVAIREGVPVKSITLFIFGGMAHIGREPATAGSEFRIVAAGPGTSLLLAGLFFGAGAATGSIPEVSGIAYYLAQINFVLAAFNLVPAFPLDGGRLLRAALWRLSRSFQTATRWAANIGMALAGLAVAGGLAMMLFGSVLNGIWIAFVGWYISHMARESYRQSLLNKPWEGARQPVSADRLASITIRTRPLAYRSAVVRVEAVNHAELMGLPVTGRTTSGEFTDRGTN